MESLRLLQRESIKHSCINLSLQDPLWKHMWSFVERSLIKSYTHFRDLQRGGLQEILTRPWFRRVWILQEVALARVGFILCGTKSVSARLFALVPMLLDITPDTHCQSVIDIMPSPWRKTSWWSKSPDLRTLLLNFGDSEATEPRDLVYALRGISSDAARKDFIIPDYNKSEEDLIREVVQFVERCELEDLALTTPPRTIRDLIRYLRALNLDYCMYLAEKSLPHEMEMLLERPEVRINEEIVTTAAAHDKTGEVIKILLRHRGKDFTVSEDVLTAAASNLNAAKEVLDVLLQHHGGRITISEEVLLAAAGNTQCGYDALFLINSLNYLLLPSSHLLPSNQPQLLEGVSTEVIIIAAENEGCGDKVLSLLLSSYQFRLEATLKEALMAAANNKGCGDR